MTIDLARTIAEAYRWQRRLGAALIEERYCYIVSSPACPEVWDLNHADKVTAASEPEIEAVFAAMDACLAHTPWRVVHADCFTPDAFLARLALEGFDERPPTIQMALKGELTDRGAGVELHAVQTESDWQALLSLLVANHAEGKTSGNLDLPAAFSASMLSGFRAKGPQYKFYLAMLDGAPAAYGACAKAPNGAGMIEDLFTLPAARRRGIATGMIAAFADRLRASGCHPVFLGALANDEPKRLYARLGFRPITLARAWVRNDGSSASKSVLE